MLVLNMMTGKGIQVPDGIYKNGKFGPYIDCSSFVDMCLYEYGIHTGNENIVKFIYNYRVEAEGSNKRSRRTSYSRSILLYK